jgi:hypothetical protein
MYCYVYTLGEYINIIIPIHVKIVYVCVEAVSIK